MPARQIAETEMANAGADEFCHFIADFVEHPADLAVQALLQDDTQTGRTHCLQARQPSTFAGSDSGRHVGQQFGRHA